MSSNECSKLSYCGFVRGFVSYASRLHVTFSELDMLVSLWTIAMDPGREPPLMAADVRGAP